MKYALSTMILVLSFGCGSSNTPPSTVDITRTGSCPKGQQKICRKNDCQCLTADSFQQRLKEAWQTSKGKYDSASLENRTVDIDGITYWLPLPKQECQRGKSIIVKVVQGEIPALICFGWAVNTEPHTTPRAAARPVAPPTAYRGANDILACQTKARAAGSNHDKVMGECMKEARAARMKKFMQKP